MSVDWSGRAASAAKIDSFAGRTCAAAQSRQLRVCASAQARGTGLAGRDPSAWGKCAVESFVWMCCQGVRTTRLRPPKSISGALSPATCNPLPRGCRLGRATDVTLIKALWRDPSGGFVLLGSEMDAGGHRSCTKFKNWNRLPEQPARSLRAREAPGPLGTRRSAIGWRDPAGACASRLSTQAARTWSARAKGSKPAVPAI